MSTNLIAARGDTIPFLLDQIRDEAGALVTTLSGWAFFFTLKNSTDVANNDSAAVISKSSASGMTVSGTTVSWEVTAAESDALLEAVDYIWDVQSKTPAGRIFTEQRGTLRLTRDVSRRTS